MFVILRSAVDSNVNGMDTLVCLLKCTSPYPHVVIHRKFSSDGSGKMPIVWKTSLLPPEILFSNFLKVPVEGLKWSRKKRPATQRVPSLSSMTEDTSLTVCSENCSRVSK